MKYWYQILTHVNIWYQIITDVKNLCSIVTDVSDKLCEELELNARCSKFGVGWGVINVRNTHVCYMEFDLMRIFHKVLDIGT